MKALNNKGFAITTVLYSLLVMATLILFLLIGNLSFERRSTDDFVSNIEDDLNELSNNQYGEGTNLPSAISVEYQTFSIRTGWQEMKHDDEISRTVGETLPLNAFEAVIQNKGHLTGDIEYRAHIQDIGWQDYVKNGSVAGTTAEPLRLEAFQMRLTGDLANYYDIYYRAHIQDIGWQDYVKNDEIAGTVGESLQIEAIQIKLELKSQ